MIQSICGFNRIDQPIDIIKLCWPSYLSKRLTHLSILFTHRSPEFGRRHRHRDAELICTSCAVRSPHGRRDHFNKSRGAFTLSRAFYDRNVSIFSKFSKGGFVDAARGEFYTTFASFPSKGTYPPDGNTSARSPETRVTRNRLCTSSRVQWVRPDSYPPAGSSSETRFASSRESSSRSLGYRRFSSRRRLYIPLFRAVSGPRTGSSRYR